MSLELYCSNAMKFINLYLSRKRLLLFIVVDIIIIIIIIIIFNNNNNNNNKVYYRLSQDIVTCNVDRDVSTFRHQSQPTFVI